MFLTLDGIDGVGKSTQMELLAAWLEELGRDVVSCRDPGSTNLGEDVRGILLGDHDTPVSMRSEMLLYMAARAQLVDEVIRPALDAGKTVLCDRFLLANVVYQGYGGGLDIDELWTVGRIATGGLEPTRTLVLDLPAEAAFARMQGDPDRMEKRGVGFMSKVRDGFLAEARQQAERIRVVCADAPITTIHQHIRDELASIL